MTKRPTCTSSTTPWTPVYSELGGFFPVDGRLFGNEGEEHNTNFTFELHTKFKFCADDAPFYFAQEHFSRFRIETNVVPETADLPTVIAGGD